MSDETDFAGPRQATESMVGLRLTEAKPNYNKRRIVSHGRFAYDMNHSRRGDLLVINNKKFKQKHLIDRYGAEQDDESLRECFEEMSFDVDIRHNLTSLKMKKAIEQAADKDHSDADCFCCAILTHGEDGGIVHATDCEIKLETLFAPLKQCQTLVGKPKILIIQACRGEDMDEGVMLEADSATKASSGTSEVCKLPMEADFLYIYSTVPGYRAFRSKRVGSYFIKYLCDMLNQYRRTRDLLWILTKVNHELAYEYESRSSHAEINAKKQVSSFVSMLTKEIYLTEDKEDEEELP